MPPTKKKNPKPYKISVFTIFSKGLMRKGETLSSQKCSTNCIQQDQVTANTLALLLSISDVEGNSFH